MGFFKNIFFKTWYVVTQFPDGGSVGVFVESDTKENAENKVRNYLNSEGIEYSYVFSAYG